MQAWMVRFIKATNAVIKRNENISKAYRSPKPNISGFTYSQFVKTMQISKIPKCFRDIVNRRKIKIKNKRSKRPYT